MEKILIIGAGDFQLPLIRKAAEDYEVLLAAPVVSEKFHPFVSKTLLADVRDKEKILDFARQEGIVGVTTDQTDIAVRSVAYVAENMSLPGIGYETGCLFTDKARMRARQVELGIPVLPNRKVFSVEEAVAFWKELGTDVIIKPIDTQGSRGVQICRNETDIARKFGEASRWSSDKSVLVELFARGREFVIEGLAFNYDFHNLCIGDTYYFDLPDAFAARNRIFPTDAPDELRERVLELNTRIIEGFGLKQGITHSEFIMHGDEIYLIETAARGGGVFISSDLISLSCGLDTEKFLLDIATGKQKEPPVIKPQLCACGYMAFYIPVGEIINVQGIDEVCALDYVHHHQLEKLKCGVHNSEGHIDKTSRLALIVSAPDRAELDRRMRSIRNTIKAEIRTDEGIEGLIWA